MIKRINKGLEDIGNKIDAPFKITSVVARHSFSTISMGMGSSISFIQKALGHSDSRTTENYLGSFSNDKITKHSNDLLSEVLYSEKERGKVIKLKTG